MAASGKRDFFLIVVLGFIIVCLLEFRFNVSTRILLPVDPSSPLSRWIPVDLSPTSQPGSAGEELDEYGEPVQKDAVPPPPVHQHHSSSLVRTKHHKHGKGKGSSAQAQHQTGFGARLPVSALVKHAPGLTILDHVYMLNGTLYIVRLDTFPSSFPERRMMISSGARRSATDEEKEPTDEVMKIVSASEAYKLFGDRASRVDGTSFISYDHVEQFSSYYQFSAEVLLSLWRTYTSLDSHITSLGQTILRAPSRLIAPHVTTKDWRDYADMNQYVIRAAFPSMPLEFKSSWDDRSETIRPFVFDRIVLEDRIAAARGADPHGLEKLAYHADQVNGTSEAWWEPVRRNVVSFSGGQMAHQDRQVVITYVSRQAWGRRMLRADDHDRLVKGLKSLKDTYGWEVNVVELESMTRDEQVALASRTTILMGVHGNGLTSLLWMSPTPETTVMEFFYPEGFSYDYEYTARMLGIKHYGFWNDSTWTFPNVPHKADYPRRGLPLGFHGNDIPIDANVVVKLCVERLRPTTANS